MKVALIAVHLNPYMPRYFVNTKYPETKGLLLTLNTLKQKAFPYLQTAASYKNQQGEFYTQPTLF